jgi:hypothetical protein
MGRKTGSMPLSSPSSPPKAPPLPKNEAMKGLSVETMGLAAPFLPRGPYLEELARLRRPSRRGRRVSLPRCSSSRPRRDGQLVGELREGEADIKELGT